MPFLTKVHADGSTEPVEISQAQADRIHAEFWKIYDPLTMERRSIQKMRAESEQRRSGPRSKPTKPAPAFKRPRMRSVKCTLTFGDGQTVSAKVRNEPEGLFWVCYEGALWRLPNPFNKTSAHVLREYFQRVVDQVKGRLEIQEFAPV